MIFNLLERLGIFKEFDVLTITYKPASARYLRFKWEIWKIDLEKNYWHLVRRYVGWKRVYLLRGQFRLWAWYEFYWIRLAMNAGISHSWAEYERRKPKVFPISRRIQISHM